MTKNAASPLSPAPAPVRRARTRRRPEAAPLPGPASLVHPGARGSVTCRSCRSDRVTTIAMTLTDGSRVHLASCHSCEHRTWMQDGTALALSSVLDKTRKTA